ncbi:hypothetical protein [uncultured Ramlibacter sp.]|uniref:hypothetical protein n=1 Tax=uncultured Ramlibacter sp. TaxID=260755 RepID=UPI00263A1CAB|nr:hypothetical protein [uncultured Ramlibacter sp.]
MTAQSQDRFGDKEPKAGEGDVAKPKRVPNADMQSDDAGTADSGNEPVPGEAPLERSGSQD